MKTISSTCQFSRDHTASAPRRFTFAADRDSEDGSSIKTSKSSNFIADEQDKETGEIQFEPREIPLLNQLYDNASSIILLRTEKESPMD